MILLTGLPCSLALGRRGLVRSFVAGAAGAPLLTSRTTWAVAPTDGLFPDCPAADICVSSQDDRPQAWDNPWVSEDDAPVTMQRLRGAVLKLGGNVVEQSDRYLRAEFTGSNMIGGQFVDEAEFFYTPNDVLVQFRAARRGQAFSDGGENRRRLERARIMLGYEKVPVLRNRRRALVVVESPFDSFGPAMYGTDELGFTARDMVPAESKPWELDPLAAPVRSPSKSMLDRLAEELTSQADDRVRERTPIRAR